MGLKLVWFIILFLAASCSGRRSAQPQLAPTPAGFPFYSLEKTDDIDILIREIGDRPIVLLGEASHGTAEYYTWRAEITRKLIRDKGFNVVVVEGDWADLFSVNEWVKGAPGEIDTLLNTFSRWPQWLWANREAADFLQSLKEMNNSSAEDHKSGFYGLDVFDFYKSVEQIRKYTSDQTILSRLAEIGKCLEWYSKDAIQYSEKVAGAGTGCQAEAEALWAEVRKLTDRKRRTPDMILLEQNAAVILNGERYFRTRTSDHSASWNGRVNHMQETIRRLMEMSRNRKVVVWAHNTHVGDAHYTDMPTRQRTNIGQLLRREYGVKNVYIVGFGSYQGEVIAARFWGDSPVKRKLRPAKEGTWEHLLHRDTAVNKIIFSKDLVSSRRLTAWVPQRAIGVVHTETYIPSIIPKRYDAFIFIDSSHAIGLLPGK